jgi:hypothetical protein
VPAQRERVFSAQACRGGTPHCTRRSDLLPSRSQQQAAGKRERARERVSGGFKKAGRTEAAGKRAAASKARTQATTSEAQAEAAASRKLASVRADL